MFTRARTSIIDVYRYQEVLLNLLSQDLKVKYKRTFFGYIWSLLNPVLQLVVLTAVFSHFVGRGMKDYTLYLFSGLLAWTFFQNAVVSSSTALLENENFIKKIYLPKLLFPLSKVCLKGIDFLFSLVALSLIGIVLGFGFSKALTFLPAAIVLLTIFTLGVSIIASVVTVYFRDVQYLLGVVLQLLYFATPIIYPVGTLPEHYQRILKLNPLFPFIRLFQDILYAKVTPSAADWGMTLGLAVISLIGGIGLLVLLDEEIVFRM